MEIFNLNEEGFIANIKKSRDLCRGLRYVSLSPGSVVVGVGAGPVKMHRATRIALWVMLITWIGRMGCLCLAQPAVHTRVFRPSGSSPATVSISPTGTIVSKTRDSSKITLLDGFTRREIGIPEEITHRVVQSRSGQIWSVTSEGILLNHAGNWSLFGIPEVRTFLANPARHLRQIALLPAEVNHVLILLPERLLDFDSKERQTKILKEASATGLGEFSEIQEGLEDSIWISGTYGIARIQGPTRKITAQSPWREYLLSDTNEVNSLQRVFEFSPGDLTSSANSPNSESRSIVHLRDGKWSSFSVPNEKIRQAWRAWDGMVWGFSTMSLFRVNEEEDGAVLRREPVSGGQMDMALESGGAFWIASADGLVRYAPHLWRSKPELEDLQTSIHSILFEPNSSDVWLAAPEGLIQQTSTGRRRFPWPEEMENLPARQSAFRMPDGRILIGAPTRPLLFDPKRAKFSALRTPRALHVHLVGELRDGSVVAWFEHSDKEAPPDLRLMKGEEFERIELPVEKANRGDVLLVKEGANGDLWICFEASVLRLRKSTGTVEHHGPENGLRTDRIFALAEVGEGRIWCGTASRIYEYRGQRWEPILNTQARVTDIVADQGNVWVSTIGGIHRFVDNNWFFHGSQDGLPQGTVYTLRMAPNERVWAGTSRGAFLFDRDADLDPPRTLPPEIEESPSPSAGEPTRINFRGLDKWDYTLPQELLFSYRLDEGSWTPFSNVTSRVFHKLSAGNHAIEVRAMDRNGNKAELPSRLDFAVVMPWFKDPRLVVVSIVALCVTLVLAGLAVNRHLQLKRSYAEVERKVEQRTKELERATQELVHSQKMRALGTMAAGIAHDFNNILSIIKGSAQIIENNVDDKEKIRTRVNRIQMVVEQGTTIVKSLLGLGKTGEKDVTECDIGRLLHETRKLIADRFPETVQFQVNAAADLPQVVCSPEVLQQILLNLILNAVEAMHNNGVIELAASLTNKLPRKMVLEPAVEKRGTDPLWVEISVIDQGGGIAPQNLQRIFEPFFTTKAFSTRRGTGLGLSMVYELAKSLGYGLAVRTNLGQGSSFLILVPCVQRKLETPKAGRRKKSGVPA